MQVKKDKVVSFNYTLKNDNGDVIDTSEKREPLSVLQGSGSIIPGLENALEGKEKGDAFSVSLEAGEGYGEYDDQLIFSVPKDRFQDAANLSVGTQVQAQNENGGIQIFTVKEIDEENVILDANHPLAGEKLHFDVSVEEVRDASKEEKDHGHAHTGDDGH